MSYVIKDPSEAGRQVFLLVVIAASSHMLAGIKVFSRRH
jgi:hypothetical protein